MKKLLVLLSVLSPLVSLPQGSGNIDNMQVIVTFSAVPTSFSVHKAPLRYNKDFSFNYQEDDDQKDIYTHGFKFLNGGIVEGVPYPGLSFTDGCGNDIKFKMSSSTSSFSWKYMTDLHDPNGPYADLCTTWPEIHEMYSFGWGITNHGLTSDTGYYDYSIARNHSNIKRMTQQATAGGIDMQVCVNVNGDTNYNLPAFQQGYLVCYIQGAPFGNPSFDVTSNWNPNNMIMGRTNIGSNQINLSSIVDAMADASINGAHHWGVVFTHSLTNGNYGYDFPTFRTHMNYIENKYGKTGSDNIWMTTEEEVLDYLLVNKHLNVNTELIEKQLKITFSGNIPTNYRFYSTSLMLESDANIESIFITNTNYYSFNGIGTTESLINLSWDGKVLIPPEQTAEIWVSKTESTHSQNDANVAVDYVMIVPQGPDQDSFRSRLCAIQQITLPEYFCAIGIESIDHSEFSIYPNPANIELTIEFTGKTRNEKIIEVYDLTGKLLLKKVFKDDVFILHIDGYPSGNYLLKIHTGKSSYTRIFCKTD